AERLEDRLQVARHGVRADRQDRGDLRVGLALRETRQDLRLASREAEGLERTWRDPGHPLAQHQEVPVGIEESADLEAAAVTLDDQRPPRDRQVGGPPEP